MTRKLSYRALLLVVACIIVTACIALLPTRIAYADSTTYYVNNQSGSNCNDGGAGTAQSAPWCTFGPINSHTFGPGDRILLARGATWDQQMTINGSGSASSYAVIDAYGSGARPKIIRDGNASDRAIRMNDPSYWSVNNLEIGNAGTGILVFFTTEGHQGLSFNNIYVHDIRGIHHQGLPNNFSCVVDSHQYSDYIWNSAGIEITGSISPFPANQYVVQNVSFNGIEGTHNLDSVSIDWCNGATGNAQNIVLNHLNFHDDNGPAGGCDDGMRLTNTTNLTMMNSLLTNEAACHSDTGTAPIYTAYLTNANIVNSIIKNTPDTNSPDQTAIDYEGFNNGLRIRNDYIANNAGPGVEILTIHGSGSSNTNSELSGNAFVNNATANRGQYVGAIAHIGSDATPTGTIRDNLYSEPTGLTSGDFSAFTLTNNVQASSANLVFNAGNDFSSTQGTNGWSYQYSNDGTNWNNLPFDATVGQWRPTGSTVPEISQFEQHPDVCSACWVGRTWTAATAGTVSIRGRVLKSDTGGGNGIIARITKNGTTIWGPQTVAYNDMVGIESNLDNLAVAAGDVLRFEVNNNGDNTYDSTSWDPSIAYTATGTPAFKRYYNGGNDHWVTTGAVTSGYHLESTQGYLFSSAQSGTHALYGCLYLGYDHFISPTANCEGQTVLRTEGWAYDSAPSGVATTQIYRCYTGSDHFVSTDPNCEGQRVEGPLGYVLNAPQ